MSCWHVPASFGMPLDEIGLVDGLRPIFGSEYSRSNSCRQCASPDQHQLAEATTSNMAVRLNDYPGQMDRVSRADCGRRVCCTEQCL
ncbi:hypothetical protein BAUCODRAFT_333203 [Baudoinia panamericana UAMH 10762]|uniref:Uncharacterized protein n=1 Tax=Baudoinia panamericana (strain UAMH 10762) TaxID=717646 RepID=M2MWQ4_BAUPA|nr:uncharacterized protein BAUCODRAFT_333203 [Baudoinia panamericana UAMH 10762]EMC91019.1 hypothetical protein BAUCODRAFT_333203 [Baudoinia panamericana UAMH 10762]